MSKLEELNRTIAALGALNVVTRSMKESAEKELDELKLTDFSFHMTTALNGVYEACDEVKKVTKQMEASE